MINEIIYLILFFILLIGVSIPLGKYMAHVFQGERTFMSPVLRPAEMFLYRLFHVDEKEEMTWKGYLMAFMIFNALELVFLFLLQISQGLLPLNPQKLSGVRWDTALNTAISFVTNTNWQAYGGESTMSYLTQMLGLTVQNFISAAVGIAPMLALIRGFTRKNASTLGNFWVDSTRAVLYVLLPISILVSVILVSQGVVQSFNPYVTAQTIEGGKQVIPLGPAASQIAIKQFGSNGGGFFNTNSAHPFENPNAFTNFIELFGIMLIPVALVFTFGYMVKNIKQGWSVFFIMFTLLAIGLITAVWAESQGIPVLQKIGISSGMNMEGKEMRFGGVQSAIWAAMTTVVSNGSVNSMHDSLSPLTGLVCMFNMGIGEVIFGGLGVGLIGMVFYIILTMFVAGLMIGRTPEYLGKKLGPYEMILASVVLLFPPMMILVLSSTGISVNAGLSSLNNPSAHGLSEIFYAYCSAIGNNGSAYAGLNANTIFYNLTTGLAMLIGRFATIIPALALAGSLVQKKSVPISDTTFPTTSPMFVFMTVGVVMIMGALTFFPAFTLGPILEHLFLSAGKAF